MRYFTVKCNVSLMMMMLMVMEEGKVKEEVKEQGKT
jgi:hypothetical protein